MAGEIFYLDTSALIPFYRSERHSASVERFLLGVGAPVLVSALTDVEFASAISRWVRSGELAEAEALLLRNAYLEDMAAGRYQREAIPAHVFARARDLLLGLRTKLTTLDALHLSSCLARSARLVTCDRALAEAAGAVGAPCLLLD
jgi:predicted nucleic acid-binding protein